MIIDTSAVVAILFGEADSARFETCLEAAAERRMSAVTRVELACVVEGRKGEPGRADLEALLKALDAEVVAVTAAQTDLAIEGFRRFGKGRHRAGLNIGDCFAYALARHADMPLLFKGDDFIHTDVRPALVPGAVR